MFTNVHIWATSGQEVDEAMLAIFGVSTLCGNVKKYSHPLQQAFFFNKWLSVTKFWKKEKKKDGVGSIKIPSF